MADLRDWTAYSNDEGTPWCIFVHGHVDLRTIRSNICKQEMLEAFVKFIGGDVDEAKQYFHGNLNIGHWWIRDASGDDDGPDECPWFFCEKDAAGAIPITGAKFQ